MRNVRNKLIAHFGASVFLLKSVYHFILYGNKVIVNRPEIAEHNVRIWYAVIIAAGELFAVFTHSVEVEGNKKEYCPEHKQKAELTEREKEKIEILKKARFTGFEPVNKIENHREVNQKNRAHSYKRFAEKRYFYVFAVFGAFADCFYYSVRDGVFKHRTRFYS